MIEAPEPEITLEPIAVPVPHSYVEPEPPLAVNVVEPPAHNVVTPVIDVGAVAVGAATVICNVNPVVVKLHGAAPFLLTQYVVVVEGETVIEAPVPEITFEPTVVPVPHS